MHSHCEKLDLLVARHHLRAEDVKNARGVKH